MNKYQVITLLFAAMVLSLSSCKENDELSDAYGNFETTEVIVSAMANGQLVQFNLEEGDQLQVGQTVGLVDTTDLYLRKLQLQSQRQASLSRLTSVNAQLAVNRQQLQNAQNDQKRIHQLFEDGAATPKQKDDIDGAVSLIVAQEAATRSQIGSINNEAEAIRRQIDQIDESIRKSAIINPINGTVIGKYVEASEIVNFGKPLYKIADLSSMDLKVYISGSQLSQFKIGEKVTVLFDRNANENSQLTGVVSWMATSSEFTPKTIQTKEERVDLVYAMKVRVSNDGSIKIGMPGEIKINH